MITNIATLEGFQKMFSVPISIKPSLLASAQILLLSLGLVLTGCGSREVKPGKIDTAHLLQTFSSAEPSTKGAIEKAVRDIDSGNLQPAVTLLQDVLTRAKSLTSEQSKELGDTLKLLPEYPRTAP